MNVFAGHEHSSIPGILSENHDHREKLTMDDTLTKTTVFIRAFNISLTPSIGSSFKKNALYITPYFLQLGSRLSIRRPVKYKGMHKLDGEGDSQKCSASSISKVLRYKILLPLQPSSWRKFLRNENKPFSVGVRTGHKNCLLKKSGGKYATL